jgi:hypothetical protein
MVNGTWTRFHDRSSALPRGSSSLRRFEHDDPIDPACDPARDLARGEAGEGAAIAAPGPPPAQVVGEHPAAQRNEADLPGGLGAAGLAVHHLVGVVAGGGWCERRLDAFQAHQPVADRPGWCEPAQGDLGEHAHERGQVQAPDQAAE